MKHCRLIILGMSLFLFPGIALAHSIDSHMNPFMNGLLHPIFVPAHLICLLALGLLLGQQEPNRNFKALLIFPVMAIIGLIATEFQFTVKLEAIILVCALLIGFLVVLMPKLPKHMCSIAAGLTALIISLDSAQQTLVGTAKIMALGGTAVGMLLLPLVAMEFADYFRTKPWQRTSIRILGSWITASAFLVLALTFSATHG
jgi:hydrogenase/urease accessory protein HupE